MAKSPLKKISFVRETVDRETGKTTLTERDGVVPNEPHFIKLYLSGIMLYADCPAWQNRVLHALLKRTEYNTNEINLPAGQKDRIVQELGISMSSLNNAIATFVKRNLLIRTGKGVFIANPHLFGNGDWKHISKLRLTVDFSEEGVTMSGKVEKNESSVDEKAAKHLVDQAKELLNSPPITTAHSTIIPGLTPERLQWLREIVEANTVQICILGLFSSAFYSIQQLI
jgi:hypothetical protein